MSQIAVGWSLCCLPNNRLWCEFVGCVLSEVPQLIIFRFFHVCLCPYKFDIFESDDSVLPPSYLKFRTVDPGRTLFRWYFHGFFFSLLIAFFICIDYPDLHTAMQMCECTGEVKGIAKIIASSSFLTYLAYFFHLHTGFPLFPHFPIS